MADIKALATKSGESSQKIVDKITSMNLSSTNGVTFENFLIALASLRDEKGGVKRDDKKIVLHGHLENTTHTINVDEKESFTVHINQALQNDKHLSSRLPVDPMSMQIFSECKGIFH